MSTAQDAMWTEFDPLWGDLHGIGGPFIVAGGYGLYLKQNWVLQNQQVSIAIPLDRWLDARPRVTKDVDLVVGLELIADEGAQRKILSALMGRGYEVAEESPRWRFRKSLSADHSVLVELHASTPPPNSPHLRFDRIRVKRKPSLGSAGIHGRTNPEAAGCEIEPFRFRVAGHEVAVPNPVTWSVMKLVAMRDRWAVANAESGTEKTRDFSREQAFKHAQDVCRIAALTTRDERDAAGTVLGAVKGTDSFAAAGEAYFEHLRRPEGWARMFTSRRWDAKDLQTIHRILSEWFA